VNRERQGARKCPRPTAVTNSNAQTR
jgi:hypothetical protein